MYLISWDSCGRPDINVQKLIFDHNEGEKRVRRIPCYVTRYKSRPLSVYRILRKNEKLRKTQKIFQESLRVNFFRRFERPRRRSNRFVFKTYFESPNGTPNRIYSSDHASRQYLTKPGTFPGSEFDGRLIDVRLLVYVRARFSIR